LAVPHPQSQFLYQTVRAADLLWKAECKCLTNQKDFWHRHRPVMNGFRWCYCWLCWWWWLLATGRDKKIPVAGTVGTSATGVG
jgi:hypothetical protein